MALRDAPRIVVVDRKIRRNAAGEHRRGTCSVGSMSRVRGGIMRASQITLCFLTWSVSSYFGMTQPQAIAERVTVYGSVTVSGESGGVQDAAVTLRGLADGSRRTVESNSRGEFTFEAVVPGVYEIDAKSPGSEFVSWADPQLRWPPRRLTVEAGKQKPLRLEMLRAGAIEGTVVDSRDHAVQNSAVRAWRISSEGLMIGGGGRPAVTDDRGRFRIFGLPPGPFYVSAEPPLPRSSRVGGGALLRTYAPNAHHFTTAAIVQVAPGIATAADVFMRESERRNISGKIATINGTPAAGINVTLHELDPSGGARGITEQADLHGNFSFSHATEGHFVLAAEAHDRDGGRLYAWQEMTLLENDASVELILRPTVDVRGIVRVTDGSDSDELSQVIINALPVPLAMTRQRSWRSSVSRDGTFVLPQVVGPQLLRLERKGPFYLMAVMLQGRNITNSPVDFSNVGAVPEILITRRLPSVTVLIPASQHNVFGSGTGVLFSSDESNWDRRHTTTHLAAFKNGQFTFVGVQEGTYHLYTTSSNITFPLAREHFALFVRSSRTIRVEGSDVVISER